MTDSTDDTGPEDEPAASVPPPPAAPSAPPADDVADDETPPADDGVVADENPPVDEDGVSNGHRKRNRFVLVGIGAIALVVVVVLLLQGRSGSSGGAATPEAAIRQLEKAIDAQDPAGAISVIDPGEVQTLNDLFDQALARTREAGFSSPGLPVPAVALQVVGLQVDVESISPDVAKVSITEGEIKYTVDPAQLPDRLKGSTNIERREGSVAFRDLSYFTNNGRERKPFVMAVRRGGRWFLSPSYTGAEIVSDINGLPSADFSATPPTGGAANPQEVLNDLARAFSEQDVEGAVALVSQRELSVLNVYASDIRRLLRDNVDQLQISIDRVRSNPTDLGKGRTKLTIKEVSGSLSFVDSNGEFKSSQFDFDGQCLDSVSQSGDGRSTTCLPDRLGELTGIREVFVIVVNENGKFRLSPLATALEYGRQLISTVDENVVLRALGLSRLAAPAGELTSGETVDADLNKGGFVRYQFQGKANQLVVTGSEDRSIDSTIEDLSGVTANTVVCPSRCVTRLPSDGVYSVIFFSGDDAYEEGSFRAFAQVIDPKPVDVPGALGASLTDTNSIAAFTFAGTAGSAVRIQTNDNVELIDPDGSFVTCRGGSTSCDRYLLRTDGTYTLFLTSSSEHPTAVSGQVEPTSLSGFEGSDVASVSYSSGSPGSTSVALSGNPVVITATPSTLTDIVLSIVDSNGNVVARADSGFSGGVESISFTPSPGNYTVTVGAFSGSGFATLTLSGN